MDDRARLLARYRTLRRTLIDLQGRALASVGDDVLDESAAALGLLEDGQLMVEAEHELAVVFDHAIYDLRRDGRSAVERLLAEAPPPPGSDEAVVLRAMAEARFGLFAVEEVAHGLGVRVVGVFDQRAFLLHDVGLGHTAEPGLVLGTRVVAPEGIAMTTGALLVIEAPAVEEVFAALFARFGDRPVAALADLPPAEAAEVTAIVAGVALDWGAGHAIDGLDPADVFVASRPRGRPVKRPVAAMPTKFGTTRKPPKRKRNPKR